MLPFQKASRESGEGVHVYNPSIWEARAGL
jgi:hypothetical protein